MSDDIFRKNVDVYEPAERALAHTTINTVEAAQRRRDREASRRDGGLGGVFISAGQHGQRTDSLRTLIGAQSDNASRRHRKMRLRLSNLTSVPYKTAIYKQLSSDFYMEILIRVFPIDI